MSDLPATGGAGIIPAQYNPQQIRLIRDMCARDCTDNDFLLHYTQIVVSVRECAHFRGDL